MLPPANNTASLQASADDSALRSSQPPQVGASHVGHASALAIPASAASAAASLTLQPAWAGGRTPSMPQYTPTPSQMLLEEFSYPPLLPDMQQDQPPAYAQQYSLHLHDAQPTLLPPVRLSIAQQGGFFLPAPQASPVIMDPSSGAAPGALRSPSGSADQRQALRGAALRQALQSSGSLPSRSPGGGAANVAEQQRQASGATGARNGHGPAEQRWQLEQREQLQLQPPSASVKQEQRQPYLLDQRRPSPNGNMQVRQPQLQPQRLQLPNDGNISRRLPSPEQQKTQSSTGKAVALAGALVPRADTAANNGALRGTLRSPSSPAKASPELPGLEALRRKLRTSSDRRARSCIPPAGLAGLNAICLQPQEVSNFDYHSEQRLG